MQTLPERTGQRPALRRASTNLTTLHHLLQEATPAYWFERGFAHKQAQEWSQAAACFEQVLRLEPENFMAYFQCSVAHAKLNNADECRKYFIKPFLYCFNINFNTYITEDEFAVISNYNTRILKCRRTGYFDITLTNKVISDQYYEVNFLIAKYGEYIYWPYPKIYFQESNIDLDKTFYLLLIPAIFEIADAVANYNSYLELYENTYDNYYHIVLFRSCYIFKFIIESNIYINIYPKEIRNILFSCLREEYSDSWNYEFQKYIYSEGFIYFKNIIIKLYKINEEDILFEYLCWNFENICINEYEKSYALYEILKEVNSWSNDKSNRTTLIKKYNELKSQILN